eukprot:TRINITY_DN2902_c0_g1_i1.p1 TRINITY_DN2902_c0_g1~~TRINITY_DN2902_c0_g1_i1.p1  ORF type:complete len:454 (+),score=74.95 TRINITY_DN2902_c0_g1_i1:66-1427(+)
MTEKQPTFQKTITGRQVLTTASIEQIASTFAKETQDLPQIHALILAHGHFIRSDRMLQAFVNEYKTLTDDASRLRVLNFIKKWVDFQRSNFETADMKRVLDDWISYLEREKSPLLLFVNSLMTTKNYEPEDDDSEDTPSVIKKKKNGDLSPLVCYDPREIARQITLIDFEYLKSIDKEEMLKNRWLETKTSPTLARNSERGNNLAHWLVQEFLLAKTRHKTKYLAQFLRICEHLLELQNFQSLMSIYLGLNLPCMSHFIPIWKALPSKSAAIWKKMNSILDYRQNFAPYREYTKGLSLPMIPCQEIILKDLLYHNEGTQDFVEGEIIDVQKLDVMGKMIDDFRKTQERPPRFEKFPELYDALYNIPTDITMAKLDELAGVLRTSDKEESDSTSMSGFLGESTSETDCDRSQRTGGHRRTVTSGSLNASTTKLAPNHFRDRRSPSDSPSRSTGK